MSKKQKPHQKPAKKLHTQDMNESDQTEFFGLLGDDYVNNGNLKVAQKILGDYKVLLEYPPNRFWATISYNLNLQNSLDLFIRYAPRKHFLIEPLHLTGYYGTIVKEIFRSVFAIYLRLTDLEQEDAVLFDQIGVYDLIYQKWIFDIMKLTDLCLIYGEQNETSMKRICHFVFKYQAYQDDYKSTIESFHKNILSKLFEDLFVVNNKSANESELIISDIQQKMEILTLTLDSIETVLVWSKFFPQQHYLFRPEVMSIFEQMFYEFLLAKGYSRGQVQMNGVWKAHHLGTIQRFLKQALQRIIDFFVIYMRYLDELVKTKQAKQLQEHMMYLIQNFGIMKRKFKQKKGNANINKEWMLLEAISENGFPLVEFLNNVPWNSVNIPREDVDEVISMIISVLDDREQLKVKTVQNELDVEAFENLNPAESTLPQDLEEKEEQEADQEDNNEPEVLEQKEEQLTELIPKKKQKITFDQPLKDRIEMAQLTVRLYNDEPDDTYDYQEALQRPEKEYTSSDDDMEQDDVAPLQYKREVKVVQKKAYDTKYSSSYQNLDNQQRVLIQKKPQKNQDQPEFSDGEEQYSKEAYQNSGNNNQQEIKQQKYFVKGNDSRNDNRKNDTNNQRKQYDNKKNNEYVDKSDYVRNENDRKEPKVLQKTVNRDGGYVGKTQFNVQEYEQKQQQQEQPKNQQKNDQSKQQNQQNPQQNKQPKKNQQNTKRLNPNSQKFDDLYVPKEQAETNEQPEREGKRQNRGGRR